MSIVIFKKYALHSTITFLILMLSSCTQKDLRIKIEEIECKNLKLSNAQYNIQHEPCSLTTQPLTQTAVIRFKHNKKKNCLENLMINAKFSDIYGNPINNVIYKEKYSYNSPEITLTDDYLEFRFTYTLSNQTDANNLKNIEVVLFTSNILDSPSNKLNFTIPVDCKMNLNSINNYTVVRVVQVNQPYVTISLSDYAVEDGDRVDVYLNGDKILSNVLITNAGETFLINLKNGQNDLVLIALNEGQYPPNTCELRINNGSGIKMSPGLSTGQAVRIIF